MRLLFVILAHNEPIHLARLANSLVGAASDANVLIHFDGNASATDYRQLVEEVSGSDRISLTRQRVGCRWGDYSLVDAVLKSLRQAHGECLAYDYAILLSGSCLPCRPIAQLERFLEENAGREFIEAAGPEWVLDGLRDERYKFWFPFPPAPDGDSLTRHVVRFQRGLGINRKSPLGMDIRFGSQWWGLSYHCCAEMLQLLEINPHIERFFRRVYIPDEMMFPSLVNYLVPDERIAGFGLTHFQFTDRGKPTVFYDDHGDYPFGLQKFFYRKASSEATELRERSLKLAYAADDGEDLSQIGEPNRDYEFKIQAQTEFPKPGQLFYRDQYIDQSESVLDNQEKNYIVVIGSEPQEVSQLVARFGEPHFAPLGRCFSPDEVDFGPGRQGLSGLSRKDVAIRDLHPALYLCRIRDRVASVPVIGWCYGDNRSIIDFVSRDANALLISMLPPHKDQRDALLEKYKDKLKILGIDDKVAANLRGIQDELLRRLPEELLCDENEFLDGRLIRWPTEAGQSKGVSATPTEITQESISASVFNDEHWFDALIAALTESALDFPREAIL